MQNNVNISSLLTRVVQLSIVTVKCIFIGQHMDL